MLKEKESDFVKLINQTKYWRRINDELTWKIEQLSSKKIEQISSIELDVLRRRNIIFKENHLRSIMKRSRLVERVKASRIELFYLQNQLELLKWKTYPTLRHRNTAYYKKRNYSKK
jgi:hypothetical protein